MGRLVYAMAASAVLCAPIALHAEPKAAIEGQMDPDLKVELQRVIGDADRPIENRFDARRRAREAAESVISALRSEGYYGYRVDPDVSESDPPRPIVRIDPGPRFKLGPPVIEWVGTPPDAAAQAVARNAMALTPGAPGRAAEVVAAEGRVVAAVEKRGYADAKAEPRQVIVNHADHSVRPTFRIAAGSLVRLDGLDVAAGVRTSPRWLRSLAPWASGDIYDPDKVAKLERRLLDAGVYDSVTVALDPSDKATPEGLRPVVVSLSERKPRTIEAGASYATTDGAGVNVRWTHYNLLRRADTSALYGQLSVRDSRVGVDLSLPDWRRADDTLKLRAAAYKVQTDAYDETGVGANANVTRRWTKTSYVTVGVSVDRTHSTELKPGTLTTLGRNLITVAAHGDVLLDRSDDPLNPTRGWRLSARLQPTYILGDTSLPYLRAEVQGSFYQPLDKLGRTVIAARVRVGKIINGSVDQIPAAQRFYAGGGGSVRGFPYQGVGPKFADGTPEGGTFLGEASVEARHDLNDRWGLAAFVDAGALGSSGLAEFRDPGVGAGIGVRYNLGFAPIRVDFAVPVTHRQGNPAFQIYVSLGQSF